MKRALKKVARHILTEGGLVRSLKAGCLGHTMHCWFEGVAVRKDLNAPGDLGGKCGEPEKFLIEIQLLRIEGNNAVVRLWAPEQVKIVSAEKDPHCQGDS